MSGNCTITKKKPLQWKGVLIACAALGLFAIALYWAFSTICDTEHKPGELIMQVGIAGDIFIEIHHADDRGQAVFAVYEIDPFYDDGIREFLFEGRDSGVHVDMSSLEERFEYSEEFLRKKEIRLDSLGLTNLLNLAKNFEASGCECQKGFTSAWPEANYVLIYNDVIYRMRDTGEEFQDLIGEIVSLSPIKPSWHFWNAGAAGGVDLLGQYNIGVFSHSKHLGNWLELYADNTFVIRDSLDRNSEVKNSGVWSSKYLENKSLSGLNVDNRIYDITLSFEDSEIDDEVLAFTFWRRTSWSMFESSGIFELSDITPEILEELEEALEALDADELYRVDIDD